MGGGLGKEISFIPLDGGQNWCQLPSLFDGKEVVAFEQIAFADAQHGWAIPRQIGRSDPVPPPPALCNARWGHALDTAFAQWVPRARGSLWNVSSRCSTCLDVGLRPECVWRRSISPDSFDTCLYNKDA